MFKQTLISAAVLASLTSSIAAEPVDCPLPTFDGLKSAIHDQICKIEGESVDRDIALLGKIQDVKKQVEALDPGSAAESIATIKAFIDSIDKDGNGQIDGLAGLIESVEALEISVPELKRRADLTDIAIADIRKQAQTASEGVQTNRTEIQKLWDREDKQGLSEDQVKAIAKDQAIEAATAAACAVQKNIATQLEETAQAIRGISCSDLKKDAFNLAMSSGNDYVPPTTPDGSGGAATDSTAGSSDAETSTTETAATGGTTSGAAASL